MRRLTAAGAAAGSSCATDGETIRSRVVVVATGAYQRPHVPRRDGRDGSRPGVPCVDMLRLPQPAVTAGRGRCSSSAAAQSACQIAEELALSGRDVVMACGRAPWFPRRPGGRDVFEWLLDTPFFEQTADQLPAPAARLGANPQASGRRRRPRRALPDPARAGRAPRGPRSSASTTATIAARARPAGDARLVRRRLPDAPRSRRWARAPRSARRRLTCPSPTAFEPRPVERLPARIGAVVVAAGFRSRYSEWIDVPGLVDEQGFPVHVDGESVVAPDLHFVGVHFLRRRRSSLLFGVGDDAAATATRIANRIGLPA